MPQNVLLSTGNFFYRRYLVKCCANLVSGQPVSTPTAVYLAAVAKETMCPAASPQDFRNPHILVKAYKHRAARYITALSFVYYWCNDGTI